jgi:hypothetical protein
MTHHARERLSITWRDQRGTKTKLPLPDASPRHAPRPAGAGGINSQLRGLALVFLETEISTRAIQMKRISEFQALTFVVCAVP